MACDGSCGSAPFAVKFSNILLKTVRDHRDKVWKCALQDLKAVVSLGDELLKSRTRDCLGVRLIESQGPRGKQAPHPELRYFDVVLWNYAEAKLLMIMDSLAFKKPELYPIETGHGVLFNQKAVELYVAGLFANPQAPAMTVISQTMLALKIPMEDD